MKGFSGSEDFLCEFDFLCSHVLFDIAFAVSEGFLDNCIDSFLDVVVLLGDDGHHLAVEHFNFVVEVAKLGFNFLGQTFKSLCGIKSG